MENLNKLKKERTQLRRIFTKICRNIDNVFKSDQPDKENVVTQLKQLEDKSTRLSVIDERIKDLLFSSEFEDEEIEQEMDTIESYREEWICYRTKCESLTTNKSADHVEGIENAQNRRQFRLPKLEFKKFNGDVRNWIGFWGQFKKIHEDKGIDLEDKFQYLIQATEQGSAARELVESFPPSGQNYGKAIDQLRTRFARDEFLIEVYVRELLNLVLQQATKNKSSMSISSLFDKLETQLRALESLGVTSDKYAAMLYPLVESALPENILIAWERHRSTYKDARNIIDSTNRLQMLLGFIRGEVESEERIHLARTSFGLEKGQERKCSRQRKLEEQEEIPTAATIFSAGIKGGEKTTFNCIFCDKSSHSSQDCFKAQNLTLDERRNAIKKKRCCFGCLKPNHNIKMCKAFVKCLICGKKHYAIMCPDLNIAKHPKSENCGKVVPENRDVDNVLANNTKTKTLLQTLIVRLVNNNKSKTVRALIDSGSQKSYILSECAKEMKYKKVMDETIVQGVFGGLDSAPRTHGLYEITVESLDRSFRCKVPVLDQTKICNFIPRMSNCVLINYMKRKNIEFSDAASNITEITLLLGADIIGELITGELEKINNDGLTAIETRLGWTVIGPQSANNNVISLSCLDNITISDLWSLDVLGIKDSTDVKAKETLEAEVLGRFKETVTMNQDNRYEVILPWIDGHPELKSNMDLAEKRLISTTKKLISIGKFTDYTDVFCDWEKSGIIEEISVSEMQNYGHYLPRHAVVKESSATTKIRPVFDASARDSEGNSLNGCLEKGPNLIELIPSLLINFRLHRYGVTADIKKAFLQISISLNDRDFLRFLWWEDYARNKIKVYRHCKVVFGVSPSPFLLAATIGHHLENVPQNYKETAIKLKNSFYVDNCVTSVDNKMDLEKFISESKYLMSTGNFDLRGWVYNSSKTEETEESSETKVIPVLGLSWNFRQDLLYCDLKAISCLNETPTTKRGLLSAAQRVFDPIGFTCPVTLIPKLLLQETWKLKIGWDTELPKNIMNRFEVWLKQINILSFCMVPRRLSKFSLKEPGDFTLHVFCDASKLSYAACVFLRAEVNGTVSVQLVQAKSRIAPMKEITLPRLELMAAVIGARLSRTIKYSEELSNTKTYYWSDSMVALTWIKTKAAWSTFVGNRVKEICKYTEPSDWYHVPGNLNAADLPSRGCSSKMLANIKWWEGPEWLKGKPDSWPCSEVVCSIEEIKVEEKKNFVSMITCENELMSQEFKYFSNYSQVVRMIGWILRFYKNLREKRRKVHGELSYDEVEEAEIRLLKLIQSESFVVSNIRNLQIFEDESGLFRVKTKLVLGDDDNGFKYPIVLPSDHRLVVKLIEEQHRLSGHAGVQTLIGILRERYWLLKGRRSVKKVISKCVICIRDKRKPVETPFAPLPRDRIKNAAAFEVTGIDLAGPLYLKEKEKAWVVLFTCAVYRAVHLELIKSLSTDAFLMALRRFIARRGRVSVIYSDNGTNFVGTSNRLKTLNWDHIISYSTVQRIKWKFNPPTAAWWGGWWERLVRLVKELLRRNLGKASVYYEELITILCDCEAIINSRPLTYVSSNADELLPLTPSDFLQGIPRCGVSDLDEIDRISLVKRYRYVQKLRDSLRERFMKEYLAELVHYGKRKLTDIKAGDIVLVGSDNMKRINWPMGKVLEIYPGKDNLPRVARVRVVSGELIRPFQRLFPLEISSCENDEIKIASVEQKQDEEVVSFNNEDYFYKTRRGRVVKKPDRFSFKE